MKRLFTLLLAFILTLSTGCVRSVRLSGRAVVQAMGIDFRDGTYVATMRLYGLSGGGPDGAETVSAQGTTLTALLADAAVRQGKQLFLGNTRMIVFGSSLAVSGVNDALQFLNSYHQLSPSTQVAVALGEAAELLEGGDTQAFSAGKLLETLSGAQESGLSPECRLMDLIPADRDRVVPVLLRQAREPSDSAPDAASSEGASSEAGGENSSGQESGQTGADGGNSSGQEVTPAGAVLISGGKAAAYLTPEMTRGLCWLQGGFRTAVLETKTPLSAAVTHRSSRAISPELLADNVVFNMEIEIASTLLEAPADSSSYPEVAREQEHLIKQETGLFLAASCRRGYDPLDLASLLRQRFPGRFTDSDMRALLENAGYNISVICTVDRKGAASPNR